MNFRALVFLNALIVSIAFSALSFYYQPNWGITFLVFISALLFSFVLFQVFFERYILDKIRVIYKLIRHLKLGKDLKGALGAKLSDDPINEVEKEVIDWAKSKKIEIDTLKEQEKFRREFLANISHEFKTPLFSLQGYIDALQDGLLEEDPEQARLFLDKASKNLDRLNYLIQDLDEISKLESGGIPINYTTFNLNKLLNEVVDACEDRAKLHEIELIYKEKYQKDAPYVRADREKIRQVLVNLIDNSFKYGNKGGHTYIRVYEMFEQVLIEITDDGIGIEEKNLNRVFERFFRAEKSRSRKIGGSGLGLSIVKHIIEAHEQTIHVRSTEGVGTTFAFTLERGKHE
jgi:two-component system phosphate regulon sensor histidine kinase PhoR